MQSLGQPPAELICGDGDSPFDESAMPPLPPGMDPNQCSVMWYQQCSIWQYPIIASSLLFLVYQIVDLSRLRSYLITFKCEDLKIVGDGKGTYPPSRLFFFMNLIIKLFRNSG